MPATLLAVVISSYALTFPKESIIAFSGASRSAIWFMAVLTALISLYLLFWRLPEIIGGHLRVRRSRNPISYLIAAILASGLAALLVSHLAGGVLATIAYMEGSANRVVVEAAVRDVTAPIFYHRWLGCAAPLEVQIGLDERARVCLRWPVEFSARSTALEPGDVVVLQLRQGKVASVLERIDAATDSPN